MNSDTEPGLHLPRRGEIIKLGADVLNNRCVKCQTDLTPLFEKVTAGDIDIPQHCPGCGVKFSRGEIAEGFKCECGERIVDPDTAKFCTKCGRKLNYGNI